MSNKKTKSDNPMIDYVADMLIELRLMSQKANRPFLGHVLEMAIIVATDSSGVYENLADSAQERADKKAQKQYMEKDDDW